MSNISELRVIQGGKKPDASRSCGNCAHSLARKHSHRLWCVRGQQDCIREMDKEQWCGSDLKNWSPKIERPAPLWLSFLRWLLFLQ